MRTSSACMCVPAVQARLLVVLEEQKAAELAEIRGDLVKAEWGQQIRNYVLHPYRLVKDTRTGEGRAEGACDLNALLVWLGWAMDV